jgi:diguanylate cyclase (GGDEF)-like protein
VTCDFCHAAWGSVQGKLVFGQRAHPRSLLSHCIAVTNSHFESNTAAHAAIQPTMTDTESLSASDGNGFLAAIDEALSVGDVEGAHRIAESRPEPRGAGEDSELDAELALRLASCELLMSRVRRARVGADRAAAMFQARGDLANEIDAHALHARAATCLGYGVEAVEAAILATRLAEDLPAGLWTARAHLSLGVAYGWGHSWAKAERAFDTAKQVAIRHGDNAAQIEIAVERQWVRAVRWALERRGQELRPDFDGGEELLESLKRWPSPGHLTTLTPGASASLATSAAVVGGLMAVWTGKPEFGRALLDRCQRADARASSVGWLLAAQSWLRAELACASGDLEAAAMHTSRVTAWASDAQHEPLACIGHRLSCDVYVGQGRADLALAELRQLADRERTKQVHHLESRGEAVGYRLAARQSQQRIEALAAESSRFERWAHEDALTGIANLRRFNQTLDDWSAASEDARKPLCVALIDVDRFKAINDKFSHDVGDDVLRAIAGKMMAHVRDTDLAARWGGDEFAVLFRETDENAASQVALRIQEAVRQHDWSPVAAGLEVGISVGVVQAQPGDNKRSLVQRSDKKMYEQKRARHRSELQGTIPATVTRRVTGWLRRAQRVAIFVGSGTGNVASASGPSENFAAWSLEDRNSYGHIQGLRMQPREFENFWLDWRHARRARQASDLLTNLVVLADRLPNVTFITERVDGVLAMAGVNNAIELYGNAFRDRCGACGCIEPPREAGRCLACNAAGRTIRPDIVLLGEQPDSRLLAGAEFTMKRSDVVLLVDCDATTYPGAALLEKARTRGAKVVMLGAGSRTRRGMADVSIAASPDAAVRLLAASLEELPVSDSDGSELSGEGFEAMCFLSGQCADNFGVTLDHALAWTSWEIESHLGTLPWMFPLLTRSTVNAEAPMPTKADFAVLAKDEHVRDGMRRAFHVMLRHYGFQWLNGRVEKAQEWRHGFASWVVTASHHDLFISRILGALTLCGLREEAKAFLEILEFEVKHYRYDEARIPLKHWRLAVAG